MPGNDKPTPIAIFVYNRPEHTRRLLDSLGNCSRLDACPIYIFSDGSKNEFEMDKVQAVRVIIRNFANKNNAKIIESSENLGLNSSILRGISQVCEEYGRIIVLEDDLILHPRTLDFMIQALDRYENDPRVGHVSGFSFPIQHKPSEDALFLPLFNSWGWATWKRSWKDFEWSPDEALHEMNKDAGLRRRMYPYHDMFLHHYYKNEMTWDLLWHWKMHSLKKIGVFPSSSLIWCSGFDDTATHTTIVPEGYQATYEKVMAIKLPEIVVFPARVSVDRLAAWALRRFLQSMYLHPIRMFYRRTRDSIKVKLFGKSE